MGRDLQEIRDEMERLLAEQIENQRSQTFGASTDDEWKKDEDFLHRMREISAEYLAALKAR